MTLFTHQKSKTNSYCIIKNGMTAECKSELTIRSCVSVSIRIEAGHQVPVQLLREVRMVSIVLEQLPQDVHH